MFFNCYFHVKIYFSGKSASIRLFGMFSRYDFHYKIEDSSSAMVGKNLSRAAFFWASPGLSSAQLYLFHERARVSDWPRRVDSIGTTFRLQKQTPRSRKLKGEIGGFWLFLANSEPRRARFRNPDLLRDAASRGASVGTSIFSV